MNKLAKVLGLLAVVGVVASVAFAQGAAGGGGNIGAGLMGVGAGLAIGLAGIGVGIAQGYIGSAGLGTITEKPEMFGQVLVFLVIPETIIIFGFVIAFFLYGKMG
ncbi:MAG TPA: V-type ATP synthase subunit K [Trueperaceae bacterium]|nr:V-type ATP synthase subunit K [Trueperaceae bacterium]